MSKYENPLAPVGSIITGVELKEHIEAGLICPIRAFTGDSQRSVDEILEEIEDGDHLAVLISGVGFVYFLKVLTEEAIRIYTNQEA